MSNEADLTFGTGRRFATPATPDSQQYFNVHQSTGLGITSSAWGDEFVDIDCQELEDALAACSAARAVLQIQLEECGEERENLEDDNEELGNKIITQNQVLADSLGVDYAWTAFIDGNTEDVYPPGHPDYGKYWSTSFVMTANEVSGQHKLSYTVTRYRTGPLPSAPWDFNTNGRATSSELRPAIDGVPQVVTLEIDPYFQNNFYPKFYGTPGTLVWNYDGNPNP